jgi:hypothetical protein
VHSSAALPVVGLQGERGNPLPGISTPHAALARGPAFGELMLQHGELPVVVPDNRRTDMNFFAEPGAGTNSSDASQAIKTPEPKTITLASPAEESSAPVKEESGEGYPNASGTPRASPPARGRVAGKAATTTPQSPARVPMALLAGTQKVTNSTRTSDTATQKPGTRSETVAMMIPAPDARTARPHTGSGDARSDAIAALVPGPQASQAVTAEHGAAKAIESPAPETCPVSRTSSATRAILVSSRSNRGAAVPDAEAKNTAGDPASVSVSDTAHTSRIAQRIPAETPHPSAGTAISPVDAAIKPATAIAQPAAGESPGVPGAASPIAHDLRARPAGIPLPFSKGAPTTVSTAFTRMDSAAPPRVLESAPQRLSVGVRDSGLGWVEIRTHSAAGQVSAVLATASSHTHAVLQTQMSRLRDYLAGQEVRVDHLSSERLSPSGGSSDHAAQQESRSGPSGDAKTSGEGPPMAAAFVEAAEEDLSYINVRV